MKQYRKARNKDNKREYERKYYHATKNTPQAIARRERYSTKNRDKLLERKRLYYHRNKEVLKQKIKARAENKDFGRPRKIILDKYKNICQVCLKKFPAIKLVVHHRDGKRNNNINNLVALCRGCHMVAHAELRKNNHVAKP